jgi:SAM-dependent methyltransferase
VPNPFSDEFDAAVNLLTNFECFEREERALQVLREVSNRPKPGGRFLLVMTNREWLMRYVPPCDWHVFSGFIMLQERSFLVE